MFRTDKKPLGSNPGGLMERFFDVLFEVSNEDRHRILLQLEEKPLNLSGLSRLIKLSLPETSRHVTRLVDVELIEKRVDGAYSITSFGALVLKKLKEIEFFTIYKDYLKTHTVNMLPHEFVTRLGDLSKSRYYDNMMEFLQFLDLIIEEAKEYVWIQVDQYPITTLSSISSVLNKGIRFRIIESRDAASSPKISSDRSQDRDTLDRVRFSPLTEHATLEKIDSVVFVSNKMAAIAFPSHEGRFDYRGFATTDEQAIEWCRDLFLNKWEKAEPLTPVPIMRDRVTDRIVLEGRDDPHIDLRTVQDAVNNYREVVLRGVFNFGASGITISRSCKLKGEGRENSVPSTKLYKTGWQIPFTSNEWLVRIRGEDIDVTIENLHFIDFNDICIAGYGGNSLTIKNNRITLETGFARGRRHPYGDMVVGIFVGRFGERESGISYYPSGVVVEGNYLDFALSHLRGGYLSQRGRWEDTGYHPNLLEEYYIGVGVFVNHAEGKILVQDNTVRNMNAVGINVSDCMASADAKIRNNTIVSEIYGSHAHGWVEAGFGISVHSAGAWSDRPGFKVEIADNTINCTKIVYGGINISGPFNAPEGSGKFREGSVINNKINLNNGAVGIKAGRNDNVEVADNVIAGKAYYGIRVHGKGDPQDVIMYAEENIVRNNDMTDLKIKAPDDYSDKYSGGIPLMGSLGESETAHVWLDSHSKNNLIQVKADETVIDEGEGNTIVYSGKEA